MLPEKSRQSLKLEKASTNGKMLWILEFQGLIPSRWLYWPGQSVQPRLYQDAAGFLQNLTSLKFMWKYRRSKITKDISRKNTIGGLTLSDLKT